MNEWRKEYRGGVTDISGEAGWTLWKVFTRLLIPLIILSVVLGTIGWGLRILGQPAKVVSNVMQADNILYNYEWFKQAYQDIKALDQQLVNAQQAVNEFSLSVPPRKDWDYPTSTEYGRLNAVVLGIKNQRQTQVATYNARSHMVSRSIFKTGELPDHIE